MATMSLVSFSSVSRQPPVANNRVFLFLRNTNIGRVHQTSDTDASRHKAGKSKRRYDGVRGRIREPSLLKGARFPHGEKRRANVTLRCRGLEPTGGHRAGRLESTMAKRLLVRGLWMMRSGSWKHRISTADEAIHTNRPLCVSFLCSN